MRALITGAAGSGTSTLAAALAEQWGAAAIEADSFFWLPTDPPYKARRDPEQRRVLFEQELWLHEHAVVAGSVGGWGVDSLFDLVVFLYVEAAVRIRRLQLREVARFGKADPAFIEGAAQYDEGLPEGRSLAKHEAWLRTLSCPVVSLVGERSVAEQIALVAEVVRNTSIAWPSSGKRKAAVHVESWLPKPMHPITVRRSPPPDAAAIQALYCEIVSNPGVSVSPDRRFWLSRVRCRCRSDARDGALLSGSAVFKDHVAQFCRTDKRSLLLRENRLSSMKKGFVKYRRQLGTTA